MTPSNGSRDESSTPAHKGALTPRRVDFPRWYQEVVARAELAENGPVRGTMVIRPWGYAIWERLQSALDERIKTAGAENAYFPLFIPESFLHLEAEHVEGFSPELAVVTHGGGRELEEPVVVRPTSETVINSYFANWVQSYRDLPLLVNQWANAVRWELRPRLFLRTSEFLWQEGHTAHATEAEARAYALRIIQDVYVDTMTGRACIPVLTGLKTARERFAGAVRSWACEGMMGDGKALQMGTSHELGQNFARPFGIQFTSEQGSLEYVWQTSWGVSTRLIGALIMAHGDDAGLRLPPELAPLEVVVLLVRDEPGVRATAESLAAKLQAEGHRVRIDDRVATSFGRRSVDWELKGVPVRVEIGPRDLAGGTVTVVTRHTRAKAQVAVEAAATSVNAVLSNAGDELLQEAREFRRSHTAEVSTLDEAVEAARAGFARIPWSALGDDGEDVLSAEGLSVRCLQRVGDPDREPGPERDPGRDLAAAPMGATGTWLADNDDPSSLVAVVARAY